MRKDFEKKKNCSIIKSFLLHTNCFHFQAFRCYISWAAQVGVQISGVQGGTRTSCSATSFATRFQASLWPQCCWSRRASSASCRRSLWSLLPRPWADPMRTWPPRTQIDCVNFAVQLAPFSFVDRMVKHSATAQGKKCYTRDSARTAHKYLCNHLTARQHGGACACTKRVANSHDINTKRITQKVIAAWSADGRQWVKAHNHSRLVLLVRQRVLKNHVARNHRRLVLLVRPYLPRIEIGP